MKIQEKKITGLAILLTLTLVIGAGAYLTYRAWDYWSADQTYADIGRNAVRKENMAELQERKNEMSVSAGYKEKNGQDAASGWDDADKDRNKSTKDIPTAETINGTKIPDKPVIDWNELAKSGKDIVAWLDIPALGIAYPVVQGDDNEFYLHHLPNGEYKNAGSLFMEAANNSDLTDINTVIYGHNMDNGSMFGKFRNMTDEDYMRQPYLWLCTREKACLYAMISLHISHVDDESYTLFERIGSEGCRNGDIDDILSEDPANELHHLPSGSNVAGWIRGENRRSYINMPIPVSAMNRVVTLSTCASYSDERRVLQAILVREYTL